MTQYKMDKSVANLIGTRSEDPLMDFRARLLQNQAEAAARRRADLADQSSQLKSAEERIRIWERVHAIALPKDSAHRLIDVIAASTRLTGAEVRDEQRRRAAPNT